ncbi:hypothetical protein DFH06DRAFT_1185050 [Mycena polygramma]|nr:hypothetical protein DFH06DRAFT_1185050 [Mycena polygramma]
MPTLRHEPAERVAQRRGATPHSSFPLSFLVFLFLSFSFPFFLSFSVPLSLLFICLLLLLWLHLVLWGPTAGRLCLAHGCEAQRTD